MVKKEGENLIFDNGACGYVLHETDFNTPERALHMLAHLSSKSWYTLTHQRMFINELQYHMKVFR